MGCGASVAKGGADASLLEVAPAANEPVSAEDAAEKPADNSAEKPAGSGEAASESAPASGGAGESAAAAGEGEQDEVDPELIRHTVEFSIITDEDDGGTTSKFEMSKFNPIITIGSDGEENQMCIEGEGVADSHGGILFHGKSTFYTDLGVEGAGGSLIDNVPVTPHEHTPIANGQVLQVGSVKMMVTLIYWEA
eukprot:g3637.t1